MRNLSDALCILAIIFLAVAGAGCAHEERPIVELGVHYTPTRAGQGGILAREIGRQAILLAAREQFGAGTRDAALREPFVQGSNALVLDAACNIDARGTNAIMALTRGSGHEVLWNGEVVLQYRPNISFDYLGEVAQAEAFSRGEIVNALEEAGLRVAVHGWHQTGKVPSDISQRLGHWNLFSEFRALRELDAAMRQHGESPECLGALARAYAQMGVSARMLTGAEYAVFTARALLYAQRLVVKEKGSAWALWNRAYVRALAGFQGAALEDLANARKIGAKGPPPDWVPLVDAYCHYDTDALIAAAQKGGPLSGIAAQLAFMTLRYMGLDAARMKIVERILHTGAPCDALSISEFICDRSGPSRWDSLVDGQWAFMTKHLSKDLAAMPGAPAPVVSTAVKLHEGNPTADEGLIGTELLSAGKTDEAEPSWDVLGRLIQDITYGQVWRKSLELRMRSDSANEYVAGVLPLIADHPLQALVAARGVAGIRVAESFIDHDLAKTDLSPATHKMGYFLDNPWVDKLYARRGADEDATAFEYDRRLDSSAYTVTSRRAVVRDLALNPYSPQAIAGRIETDWAASEAGRSEWESRLQNNPLVARAMTVHFAKAGDLAEAAIWGRKWVDASPDQPSYEFLAGIFARQGDDAKWKSTLDEFLQKGVDFAMNKMEVRLKMAQRMMAAEEYEEAWPYADAAAQTGANPAILCAERCAEWLGKWNVAGGLMREASQDYPSDAEYWYLWCQRTGKGDLAQARDFLQKQDSFWKDPKKTVAISGFDLLEGSNDAAGVILSKEFSKTKDPWYGLHLALLYDTMGKKAQRDRVLKLISSQQAGASVQLFGRSEMVKLAAMFERCLQTGSTAKITSAWVAQLFKSADGEDANLGYFVGRFLELHGRLKDAETYYTQSIWSKYERYVNMALSGARLRALGGDSTKVPGEESSKKAGSTTRGR